MSTEDTPHDAHHVNGQNWAETISELMPRGFDAGRLQHALRLAAVYVQECDPDTDEADERLIIAWRRPIVCRGCAGEPGGVVVRQSTAAGTSVQRIGDCLAPRRARAPIVEGERAGAAA